MDLISLEIFSNTNPCRVCYNIWVVRWAVVRSLCNPISSTMTKYGYSHSKNHSLPACMNLSLSYKVKRCYQLIRI